MTRIAISTLNSNDGLTELNLLEQGRVMGGGDSDPVADAMASQAILEDALRCYQRGVCDIKTSPVLDEVDGSVIGYWYVIGTVDWVAASFYASKK